MKISFYISNEILEAIRRAIKPGVRENELNAIAADISVRHACDGAAEIHVCTGENTHPNMLGYSTRPIRPGDMIFVNVAGVSWKGYNSYLYRCFTCGKATQRQKELYAAARELLYKGLAKVKAGNTTADIVKAWPGPEHWGAKSWREVSDVAMGHGLGQDNQEIPIITPLFSVEHPITLKENMILILKTSYGSKPGEHPRQGAAISNAVVVTKDGYEMLTIWPDEEIIEAWV